MKKIKARHTVTAMMPGLFIGNVSVTTLPTPSYDMSFVTNERTPVLSSLGVLCGEQNCYEIIYC
ncbi:MAG: hypothetical protein E3K36_01780 [Candidatus Brocadia sp.]|nr:hypothetical protein [Candidatus Brocadia sp.]